MFVTYILAASSANYSVHYQSSLRPGLGKKWCHQNGKQFYGITLPGEDYGGPMF